MVRIGRRIAAATLISSALMFGVPQQAAQANIAPCSVTWGTYVEGIPWDPSMTAVRNLDTAIGRHSSIIHYYAQWGDNGSGNFSANQPWMLNAVKGYASVGVSGATPLITWEPWSGGGASNNQFPLPQIASGGFDSYVDSWAVGLRGYGSPVLLDWGHEMDGNWYPWGYGVNGNTAAQYIAAFRHVHDRFVAAGAGNVQFVWNPNVWNPSGADQRSFYPGDGYVDWMAIDVYNWGANGGGWGTLSAGLAGTYSKLAGMSSKPMMLAEWASAEPVAGDPAGVTKGQWIIDAASAIATQFTRLKAVVWFSPTGGPFALNSSADSIAGAASAFGGCGSTPPPPPPTAPPTSPPTAPPTAAPTAPPTASPAPLPRPTRTPPSSPGPTHTSPTPSHGGGSTPKPSHSASSSGSTTPKPVGGGSRPPTGPSAPKATQPASTSPVATILAAFKTDPGMRVAMAGLTLCFLAFLVWAASRVYFAVKGPRRRDAS